MTFLITISRVLYQVLLYLNLTSLTFTNGLQNCSKLRLPRVTLECPSPNWKHKPPPRCSAMFQVCRWALMGSTQAHGFHFEGLQTPLSRSSALSWPGGQERALPASRLTPPPLPFPFCLVSCFPHKPSLTLDIFSLGNQCRPRSQPILFRLSDFAHGIEDDSATKLICSSPEDIPSLHSTSLHVRCDTGLCSAQANCKGHPRL